MLNIYSYKFNIVGLNNLFSFLINNDIKTVGITVKVFQKYKLRNKKFSVEKIIEYINTSRDEIFSNPDEWLENIPTNKTNPYIKILPGSEIFTFGEDEINEIISANKSLKRLLDKRREKQAILGNHNYQKMVNNHIDFLWQKYVDQETTNMQIIGHERYFKFYCTDTAIEKLNIDHWFKEPFHKKLLEKTKALAGKISTRLKKFVARIIIIEDPVKLTYDIHKLRQLRRFCLEQYRANILVGIVFKSQISQLEFDNNNPIDFYLIPDQIMYTIDRKYSIHQVYTNQTPEGVYKLKEYESFFNDLLKIMYSIQPININSIESFVNFYDEIAKDNYI